jgi:transcriptional regulator of acetoin/glycerol metabolism
MPVSQVSAANAARSDLASDNISAIMAANGNNKSAAARALGVSRMTLWRHLRQA